MPKMYITFGQAHQHICQGQYLNKDCVAVFETKTNSTGRQETLKLFGTKFCMSYFDKEHDVEFQQNLKRFYHRGLININV